MLSREFWSMVKKMQWEMMTHEAKQKCLTRYVMKRLRHPHKWHQWNEDYERCHICGRVRNIKTKEYKSYIKYTYKER